MAIVTPMEESFAPVHVATKVTLRAKTRFL